MENNGVDPHGEVIKPLIEARNWAALVCHGIAHQYPPAFTYAIEILKTANGPRIRTFHILAEYLTGLFLPQQTITRETLEGIMPSLEDNERQALIALSIMRDAQLDPSEAALPIDLQGPLLQRCVIASQHGMRLGKELANPDLVAFFTLKWGEALCATGALDQARKVFKQALILIHTLFRATPRMYHKVHERILLKVAVIAIKHGNINLAHKQCDAALRLRRQLDPQDFRRTRPEMAATLVMLAQAQRLAHDLKAAHLNYKRALHIRRELAHEDFAQYAPYLALTLNYLGKNARQLGRAKSARSWLQESLILQEHLADVNPRQHCIQLARVLFNLGTVCWDTHEYEKAGSYFQKAVDIQRHQFKQGNSTILEELSDSLANMGNVQKECKRWHYALDSYHEALNIRSTLNDIESNQHVNALVLLHNNIGAVYNELEYWKDSYDHFVAATQLVPTAISGNLIDSLALMTPELFINAGLLVRKKNTAMGWPSYKTAFSLLQQGCHLTEKYRGILFVTEARDRVVTQLFDLYLLHIENCLDLLRANNVSIDERRSVLGELLWASESIRSRQLLDRLGSVDSTIAMPQLTDWIDELSKINLELNQTATKFEHKSYSQTERGTTLAKNKGVRPDYGPDQRIKTEGALKRNRGKLVKIGELDRSRHQILKRIHKYYMQGVSGTGISAKSCEEIWNIIPDDRPTAFVQFTVISDKALALILLKRPCVDTIPIELTSVTPDWIKNTVADWIVECQYSSRRGVKTFVAEWDKNTPPLLQEISDAIILPILRKIPNDIMRLVVSPHHFLQLLPFHICPLDDAQRLCDLYEVVYTPSFSLLRQREEDGIDARTGEMLLVENPTGDLRFSQLECLAIRQQHPNCGLINHVKLGAATKKEFVASAVSCRVMHYSGHGMCDVRQPRRSRIRLSDGFIGLEDMFERVRLPRCKLAVLNGCETGMSAHNLIEPKSLAAGFMFAGTRCVISSLWTLPDLSSALTMSKFYELWHAGQAPSPALRSAQKWLRQIKNADEAVRIVRKLANSLFDKDHTQRLCDEAEELLTGSGNHPFASPVHWGPFICTGMGY